MRSWLRYYTRNFSDLGVNFAKSVDQAGHIGHPLVSDPVYGAGFATKAETLPAPLGNRVRKFRRQALHAAILSFQHPLTGEVLTFESPPPADMAGLIDGFRKIGGLGVATKTSSKLAER